MPLRAAGRTSSSWRHRRASTYIRRSHIFLNCTGTTASLSQSSTWSQAVACRRQMEPNGTKWTIAGIAANELRGISHATFCCDALSRLPLDTNSRRPATSNTSPAPCSQHRRLFVRNALSFEDKCFAVKPNRNTNQNCVLLGVTIVKPFDLE